MEQLQLEAKEVRAKKEILKEQDKQRDIELTKTYAE